LLAHVFVVLHPTKNPARTGRRERDLKQMKTPRLTAKRVRVIAASEIFASPFLHGMYLQRGRRCHIVAAFAGSANAPQSNNRLIAVVRLA
jgi:hypothetical protein